MHKDYVRIVARCDCGGGLVHHVERTDCGPRWVSLCEGCGNRWRCIDDVLRPVDRDPVRESRESELLACFRRLPAHRQAEVLNYAQKPSMPGSAFAPPAAPPHPQPAVRSTEPPPTAR